MLNQQQHNFSNTRLMRFLCLQDMHKAYRKENVTRESVCV